MKKLFLLFLAVLAIGMCASAQTRTVRGIVLDVDNDEPLPGVSVSAGPNTGSVTDIDGIFSIKVPGNAKKLTFSMVGYKNVEMQIPAKGEMIVKMTSASTALDEVIAVAYGTIKKSEYTGAASVIKADQLENVQVSNVTNALSGKVSGVQTLNSNGQPGTGSTVLIRGVGSINASTSPLYVVDGMIYNGDISAIATNDIEAMTVLKDAASTALYGERGANGVILISTKKGTEGQAKITVDMKWGGNSRAVPNYDVISDSRQYLETFYRAIYNTRHYIQHQSEAASHLYANSQVFNTIGYQTWSVPEGQFFFDQNGKFNPNATPGYSDGRYYFIADDWAKGGLINGLRQEYTASISGGTQRLNYYVSGSYLGDEGIIYGSHFKRFSTRASVDYQAKDWLKIGTNMMYTYSNTGYPDGQTNDGATTGNTFYFVNGIAPVYPMYIRNPDGSIKYNETYGKPIYDYGDGKDYGNGRMGNTRNQSGNPTGQLVYDIEEYLSDILDAKWYATLTPITGLNITGNAGLYLDNTRTHSLANGLYGQFANIGGQAYQVAERIRVLSFQGLANYNKTFADIHNIDLMVGYESESFNTEYTQAIGSNLYQPLVPFVNNTSTDKRGYGASGNLSHRAFIARARYNFDGKYYVSASVRRGASSRFAPDKRWGTFWSASAGWDISKENFMIDFSQNVDILKFKVSFGQNGNDAIGANYIAYADQYQIVGSDGIWSDGSLYYKGNKDITWEKSNAFNTGFDFSFWKGTLSGSIEYYNRQTSDMLFNLPVQSSLGYASIPKNVGSMRNNGFELELNYRAVNTKDITLEIFGNITLPSNKVLKLAPEILNDEGYWKSSTYRWFKEGESMYQYFIPEYAGVDPKTGYALYWAVLSETQANSANRPVGSENVEAGEKYKTPEWSYARDTNPVATGNLMPKMYGGFGVSLNAYGFDLTAAFSYQVGGRIFDYGYQNLMQSGSNIGMALHKDALNAWAKEGDITSVPMLYLTADYQYSNALSDRFLISSNYLSLNNLTVGYTFPKKWIEKIGLSSLRIYGQGENVALWSKRKGLDPRQGFIGSENYTYSPIRTISGGIRVGF
ncbi:MAG: SusC/RagA family TonB-linked outer membrane protein [Muribaculaceae bacterium]|nr:SusC/RagA family TonB-linked outer membrane protein [Muribaculaceae bacterium]